jgi:hypothetical protein
MSIGLNPVNHALAASQHTQPQPHSHSHSHFVEDDEETTVPSPSPSDEINSLARYLSAQQNTGDLFNYEKESVLDPYGPKFDARLWISKFANLDDWASVPGRKSGISFKDLTVFGYGTDAG